MKAIRYTPRATEAGATSNKEASQGESGAQEVSNGVNAV